MSPLIKPYTLKKKGMELEELDKGFKAKFF